MCERGCSPFLYWSHKSYPIGALQGASLKDSWIASRRRRLSYSVFRSFNRSCSRRLPPLRNPDQRNPPLPGLKLRPQQHRPVRTKFRNINIVRGDLKRRVSLLNFPQQRSLSVQPLPMTPLRSILPSQSPQPRRLHSRSQTDPAQLRTEKVQLELPAASISIILSFL